MSAAILRAMPSGGLACALSIVLWSAFGTPAAAQGGGGLTLGNRNNLGPRYEPYPERMWDVYTRTGRCPPLEVRTRLPNGRVAVRRVPWNPRACGFSPLE
jgi:hypothetical protein